MKMVVAETPTEHADAERHSTGTVTVRGTCINSPGNERGNGHLWVRPAEQRQRQTVNATA